MSSIHLPISPDPNAYHQRYQNAFIKFKTVLDEEVSFARLNIGNNQGPTEVAKKAHVDHQLRTFIEYADDVVPRYNLAMFTAQNDMATLLENERKQFKKDRESFEKILASYENKLAEKEKETTRMFKTIEKFQEDNLRFDADNKRYNAENEEFRSKIQKIEQENEKYRQECQNYKQDCQKYQQECQKYHQEIVQHKKDSSSLIQVLSHLTGQAVGKENVNNHISSGKQEAPEADLKSVSQQISNLEAALAMIKVQVDAAVSKQEEGKMEV